MKNYEVLIVIFAGLGIAYYMYDKTKDSSLGNEVPKNVKIVSAQSPSCAFPGTTPPCCVGVGGVRLQPTTTIFAPTVLTPPEIV